MLTTRLGLLGQATQPAFDLSADWSHSAECSLLEALLDNVLFA
jgi:hypothetical protein